MSRLILAALIAALVLPSATFAKGPKHCPPGLAKKKPACVPPGLAMKGKATSDDDDQDYPEDIAQDDIAEDDYYVLQTGDRVIFEGEEYTVVRTGDRTVLKRGDDWYRLPRLDDGYDYVRVGNAIVQVDRKTKAVFQIIELADLILG